MIGKKLAHYEITGHLGTGGMGEVYQATDSKLGRNVAIKLLPEAFSHSGPSPNRTKVCTKSSSDVATERMRRACVSAAAFPSPRESTCGSTSGKHPGPRTSSGPKEKLGNGLQRMNRLARVFPPSPNLFN